MPDPSEGGGNFNSGYGSAAEHGLGGVGPGGSIGPGGSVGPAGPGGITGGATPGAGVSTASSNPAQGGLGTSSSGFGGNAMGSAGQMGSAGPVGASAGPAGPAANAATGSAGYGGGPAVGSVGPSANAATGPGGYGGALGGGDPRDAAMGSIMGAGWGSGSANATTGPGGYGSALGGGGPAMGGWGSGSANAATGSGGYGGDTGGGGWSSGSANAATGQAGYGESASVGGWSGPSANAATGQSGYGGGFGTPGMGAAAPQVNATDADIDRMARAMISESYPNAPIDSLQSIADVIRNRVLSSRFPDTPTDVINQNKQFSVVGTGAIDQVDPESPEYTQAVGLARAILSGEVPSTVGNSLNYANMSVVNSKPGYSSSATKNAFNKMSPDYSIGGHTFGTIGEPSDVDFSSATVQSPSPQYAGPGLPDMTRANPIPDPIGGFNGAPLSGYSSGPPTRSYSGFTQGDGGYTSASPPGMGAPPSSGMGGPGWGTPMQSPTPQVASSGGWSMPDSLSKAWNATTDYARENILDPAKEFVANPKNQMRAAMLMGGPLGSDRGGKSETRGTTKSRSEAANRRREKLAKKLSEPEWVLKLTQGNKSWQV